MTARSCCACSTQKRSDGSQQWVRLRRQMKAKLRGEELEECAVKFAMQLRFDGSGGEWIIYDSSDYDGIYNEAKFVWRRAYAESEDLGEYAWPADMRAEYERLTGKSEFDPSWHGDSQIQAVELCADEDEQAFDQDCMFANRVEGHATYCHNDGWLYSPRKCRRENGVVGEHLQCNCPGFKRRRVAAGEDEE